MSAAAAGASITLRFQDGDMTVSIAKVIEVHGNKCAVHRAYYSLGSQPGPGYRVSEISTGSTFAFGETADEAERSARLVEKRRSQTEFKQAMTKIRAAITRRNKKLAKEKI